MLGNHKSPGVAYFDAMPAYEVGANVCGRGVRIAYAASYLMPTNRNLLLFELPSAPV